ncbi:MAG: polyphosphate kinase [Porticoccaceae bacterium]
MTKTKIDKDCDRYPLKLSGVDCNIALRDKDEYKARLDAVQLELLKIQQAYYSQGRRAVVVLEGVDCAGKGGIIRRMVQPLDLRGVHVWPIGAPSAEEGEHHYLYRFWQRLPASGDIVVFDRSWYGRVLVERVEGFCSKQEWQRAYREINEFERLLCDDGVRVIKLLPAITRDEQLKRFEERIRNPHKRWKLTSEDIRNWRRWDEYQLAFQDMLDETSTDIAPWHVIPGNRKWYARIRALEVVAEVLSEGVDIAEPSLDSALLQEALEMLHRELNGNREKE